MNKKTFVSIVISVILLFNLVEASDLVWPPPPDKAKIQFLQSITKPFDIGIKKSFFKKIFEFFAGEETEEIARPFSITSKNGKVFITDIGLNGFHIFDFKEGRYKLVSGKKAKIESPVGIAATKDNKILIVDSILKKVLIFNDSGDFEGEFAKGFPFKRPTAISVSPSDGSIWIADTLAHQIHKFSLNGGKLLTIGKRGINSGEFNYPTGILVSKDGKVYVCDTLNFRIQVFSSDGRFLYKFGKHGDSTGDFAHPKSLAIDTDGNIYVIDGLFDAVQIFDSKGKLLLVFGQRGTKNGEFYVPASIYINDDKIYISDSYNKRVQIFKYLKEVKK